MTEKEIKNILSFDDVDDESIPKSKMPDDLTAMMILWSALPEGHDKARRDIIVAAGHDQIWFGFDVEEYGRYLTRDDVIRLRALGVFWDDGFSIFV